MHRAYTGASSAQSMRMHAKCAMDARAYPVHCGCTCIPITPSCARAHPAHKTGTLIKCTRGRCRPGVRSSVRSYQGCSTKGTCAPQAHKVSACLSSTRSERLRIEYDAQQFRRCACTEGVCAMLHAGTTSAEGGACVPTYRACKVHACTASARRLPVVFQVGHVGVLHIQVT